jgi:hypothetical protein
VTLAVKVTGWLMNDGLPDVLSFVVVAAGRELTTCFSTADVLPRLLLSPEYSAVMERVPVVVYVVV